MLTRLGGTFYRARWTVLIIALFVIVAAATYGFEVFGSLKNGGFVDPASESSKAQNLLDSKFPNSSADAIILMHSDTLHATDATFMDAATQLLTTLKARPEITSVTSYYSTHSSRFLSRDAHETFAIVHLSSSDESIKVQEYKAISPLITSPTLQIMVGGNVPVSIAINQQTMRLLGRWNWWAPAPLRALWRRVGLSESTPHAASSIGLVEGALEEVAKKEVRV